MIVTNNVKVDTGDIKWPAGLNKKRICERDLWYNAIS